MCAVFIKDFDPSLLLRRIQPLASVSTDGKVSFSVGFELFDYQAIFAEHMDFARDVPRAMFEGIVWNALIGCARASDFSSKKFLFEATSKEREYLARALQRYYLYGSLSLGFSVGLQAPSFDGCRFRFFSSLPKNVDLTEVDPNIRYLFRHRKLPTNYVYVRVGLSARSPEEAGSRATDALDLLRGLWNFQINLTKYGKISDHPQAVNSILPGPFYTLHRPDGRIATRQYWFEPEYLGPADLYDAARFQDCRRNEAWFASRLRRHPYRVLLLSCIRRYGRTLDSADHDSAILKLWSILEKLTACPEAKYDVLVRRASFIYGDSAFVRLVLNHIRRYRNRSVHAGHSSGASRPTMDEARRIVQDLLLHHIRNGIRARTIEEAVALLDLPPHQSTLRKRRKLVDFAVAFRRPRADKKK